jgi:hypothetical protein
MCEPSSHNQKLLFNPNPTCPRIWNKSIQAKATKSRPTLRQLQIQKASSFFILHFIGENFVPDQILATLLQNALIALLVSLCCFCQIFAHLVVHLISPLFEHAQYTPKASSFFNPPQ